MLDFMSGNVACPHQRNQSKTGCQSSHKDGGQPLLTSPIDPYCLFVSAPSRCGGVDDAVTEERGVPIAAATALGSFVIRS